MSTVWVVHDKGHDLTGAERFGTIHPIFSGQINVFDVSSRLLDIREALKDAKEDDFILLSGYSLLNVLASNVLLEKFGGLRILIFHGNKREYQLRTLNRSQLTERKAPNGGT